MCEGAEYRLKRFDSTLAFFFTMTTNIHLKRTQQIKVDKLMRILHPPTKLDKIRSNREFMKEWTEQVSEVEERRGS